jgi:hypothetical protein
MIIKIKAKDLKEAYNQLFEQYGVPSNEVIDFSIKDNDLFEFEVAKTTQSEIDLNKQIDNLIKSNSFQSTDIAFICTDGKVHTPDESTLFERIKLLLLDGYLPILGFSGLIDANDLLDKVNKSDIAVTFNNMVLTKEGTELRGMLIKPLDYAPLAEYPIDLVFKVSTEDDKLVGDKIEEIISDLSWNNYLKVSVTDAIYIEPKSNCPIDLITIILKTLSGIKGVNRVMITTGSESLVGELK